MAFSACSSRSLKFSEVYDAEITETYSLFFLPKATASSMIFW